MDEGSRSEGFPEWWHKSHAVQPSAHDDLALQAHKPDSPSRLHFAALEQPKSLVEQVRGFFRLFRSRPVPSPGKPAPGGWDRPPLRVVEVNFSDRF